MVGNMPVKGWSNRRGICLTTALAVGVGALALGAPRVPTSRP